MRQYASMVVSLSDSKGVIGTSVVLVQQCAMETWAMSEQEVPANSEFNLAPITNCSGIFLKGSSEDGDIIGACVSERMAVQWGEKTCQVIIR